MGTFYPQNPNTPQMYKPKTPIPQNPEILLVNILIEY